MADFNSLVSGLEQEKDDVKAYFTSFFETGRLKNYTMDPRCDRDMKKAITFMFRSKKDIRERCDAARIRAVICVNSENICEKVKEAITGRDILQIVTGAAFEGDALRVTLK